MAKKIVDICHFLSFKKIELKKMKIFSVIYKSRKTLKSFNFLKFEQILL